MLKSKWTDEDNERLDTMIANGYSVVRVAAAFNRTIQSIRGQARKIGKPFPTVSEARKKYTSGSWHQY